MSRRGGDGRIGGAVPGAWSGAAPEVWASRIGVPLLELHLELPSTNERLRELARGGAPFYTTVVADTQSRGRGRGEHRWYSPSGSGLWVSFLLPSNGDGKPGVLPLAVGVAAARALERAGAVGVGLKWPNDLLIGSRKVGGVLCEGMSEGRGGVIVGLGLNLRRPRGELPAPLGPAIGFLEEAARRPVPEPELAAVLVEELVRWAEPLPGLLAGDLRVEWDARDLLRNRRVRLEGDRTGVARRVAPDGALEVVGDDGRIVSVRAGGVRLAEPGRSPALYAGRGSEASSITRGVPGSAPGEGGR